MEVAAVVAFGGRRCDAGSSVNDDFMFSISYNVYYGDGDFGDANLDGDIGGVDDDGEGRRTMTSQTIIG